MKQGGKGSGCMTDYEICYSYRTAKHRARQIHIIAELNGKKGLRRNKDAGKERGKVAG